MALIPDAKKKSRAGRKPFDAILMFRMLILQSLYNLSDEQIEYQVRDRMSFTRFLGLEFADDIPDGTTLWVFREKLAQAGSVEKLFERFNQHLNAKGYIARGGQMVDATIVPVPKQRNSREENETVKRGETPAAWEEKRRPRLVVASCAPSGSCGRASRSACKTLSTTSADWQSSNGWPPHEGRSLTSATETSRQAEVAGSGPTGEAGICPSAAHALLEMSINRGCPNISTGPLNDNADGNASSS